MAEEKKKTDEVSEIELEQVAGGIIDIDSKEKIVLPPDKNISGSGQAEDIKGSAQGGESLP